MFKIPFSTGYSPLFSPSMVTVATPVMLFKSVSIKVAVAPWSAPEITMITGFQSFTESSPSPVAGSYSSLPLNLATIG